MVSSSSLELKLSLKPSYVPKTIDNLLKNLSNVDNDSDKLAVLNDYINQHEEELTSIAAFKRQLPQCMLLLMEALGTLKDEFMNIKNGMKSETTGTGRPLMEFLAIKRKHYEAKQTDISAADHQKYDYKGKSLMSSALHQLWNSNYENKKQRTFIDLIQVPNQNSIPFKDSCFKLSLAEKGSSREIIRGSYSKFANVGTNNGLCGLNLKAGNQTQNYQPRPLTQPIWKNNRRTWSPELHARFVEALNLLGGIEGKT
ncbi:hypothetical protein REPUB_Repub12eG0040300 [Reevesia pubescens]